MSDINFSPEQTLQDLIAACLKAGASAADARLGLSEGVSISVREGKREGIEREEGRGLSLRCFFGRRQAHVSGSDLSPAGLETLAQRCAEMARVVPEDPYCGLTSKDELASGDLDLDLGGEAEIDTDRLTEEALQAEAAALAVEGVKTVAGCGCSWSSTTRWVAASNGFQSMRKGASTALGLVAIAERDGAMERDYESWQVRNLSDRPPAAEIGKRAGTRTLARLGARKLETQSASVIYDRRISASLVGALLSAISGPAIARGVSFLKDQLGQQVFSGGIDIIDDPFRVQGMGSRRHDGEGRSVQETKIIDQGRLTTWLLSGPSARQLGLEPNGFSSMGFGDPPGVTTSNLYLKAGEKSQADLMKDAGRGVLVTDMFGPSINPNTGDYSVGVAGFWFENGVIAHPVSEITIAGDLPSMFARMIAGSDLEFRGTNDAPSILIEDMSIAGS